MKLLILPTQVYVDMPAYVSPASGRRITTRTERQRDLKETGSRPWEGLEQEKKEAARARAEKEKKLDAKIEDTIRREYHQLPPAKRRELEQL